MHSLVPAVTLQVQRLTYGPGKEVLRFWQPDLQAEMSRF